MNRYSRPAQATIQQTQVLPDIGFMSHQLEKRQQRYDVNSLELQKQEGELSKLQGYGEAAGKYIKAVDDEFKVLSNELLKKDLGDPKNAKEVRDRIYQIKNDPELNKHITAKQAYDNYQQTIAKMSAEGEIPAGNLWGYQKMWQQYSKTGEFNSALTNPTIIKGVDRLKESKELFSHIKADGGQTLAFLSSNAGKVAYENGWKGISKDKIGQTVLENLEMMMGSKLGRELTREFDMMKELGSPPAKSSVEYVYNTLMGVGNSFTHSETSSGVAAAYNKAGDINRAKAKEDNKEKKSKELGFGLTESFTNPNFSTEEKPKFKSGKFVGSGGKSVGEIWKESSNPWEAATKWWNDETPKEGKESKTKQILSAGAKINGISEEAYYNKVAQNYTLGYAAFTTPKQQADATKLIWDRGAGELNNMQIVTRDNKKLPARDGLAKELGLEAGATVQEINEALKESNFKILGFAPPGNETTIGYVASINGHNIIINDDNKFKSLPDVEKIDVLKKRGIAIANSGVPNLVELPNPTKRDPKTGRIPMEKIVMYYDAKADAVQALPQEEFKRKTGITIKQ